MVRRDARVTTFVLDLHVPYLELAAIVQQTHLFLVLVQVLDHHPVLHPHDGGWWDAVRVALDVRGAVLYDEYLVHCGVVRYVCGHCGTERSRLHYVGNTVSERRPNMLNNPQNIVSEKI